MMEAARGEHVCRSLPERMRVRGRAPELEGTARDRPQRNLLARASPPECRTRFFARFDFGTRAAKIRP
jgi:hypothetical protein